MGLHHGQPSAGHAHVPAFVGKQAVEFFGEVRGGAGDEPRQIPLERQAFGGDFGHQAWQAVGEGFEDLAFDTGTVAERGDGAAEVVQSIG